MDDVGISRSFSSSSSSPLSDWPLDGHALAASLQPSSLLFFNPPLSPPASTTTSSSAAPSSSESDSAILKTPLDGEERARRADQEEEEEERNLLTEPREATEDWRDEGAETKKEEASSLVAASSGMVGEQEYPGRRRLSGEAETRKSTREWSLPRGKTDNAVSSRTETRNSTTARRRKGGGEDGEERPGYRRKAGVAETRVSNAETRQKESRGVKERERKKSQGDSGSDSDSEDEVEFQQEDSPPRFWLFVKKDLPHRLLVAKQPGRFSSCFLSYSC